jgi:hypothetical protein
VNRCTGDTQERDLLHDIEIMNTPDKGIPTDQRSDSPARPTNGRHQAPNGRRPEKSDTSPADTSP